MINSVDEREKKARGHISASLLLFEIRLRHQSSVDALLKRSTRAGLLVGTVCNVNSFKRNVYCV